MKKLYLLLGLLAIFAFDACSDLEPNSQVPIQPTGTLGNFGTTGLSDGQTVWVWGDLSKDQSSYITAWDLTVKNGKLSNTTQSYDYPEDGGSLDFYALHGDFTSPIESEHTPLTTPFNFKVEADQTDQAESKDATSANHELSDLLYGIQKPQSPTKNPVNIPFVHILSNIGVSLKAADGTGSDGYLKGATVQILGTKLQATFTPDKTLTADQLENDVDKRQSMLGSLAGEVQPIQITTHIVPVGGSFEKAGYGQAIIIPQSVGVGTNFIEVDLQEGKKLYYTIPDAESGKFESGKYYRYNVTVSEGTLEVESVTVTPWDQGDDHQGMSLILGSVDPDAWGDGGDEDIVSTVAKPGDYLYNNKGEWDVSDGYPNKPDPSKGTCIGVVMKAGRDPSDTCTYKSKDGKNTNMTVHGYAVALFDSNLDSQQKGQTCIWSTNTTQAVGTSKSTTDFMGYSNTQKIKGVGGTGEALKTNYPACYWTTEGYENSYSKNPGDHAAPGNSSGWFFPSEGQLVCSYGTPQVGEMRDLLNQSFSAAGGQVWSDKYYYWSSSEYSSLPATNAWSEYFPYGGVNGSVKKDLYYVRALVAF